MREQLILLFAVLLAVFLAIGCTSTDTEDQPTTEPATDQEGMDTGQDSMDTGQDNMATEDEMSNTEDEDMMENDSMEENGTIDDNDSMEEETTQGEEIPVTITKDGFDPVDLEVTVGDTVTWKNDDTEVHTITADDDTFSSDDLNDGESFSYIFDEAGTYTYGSDENPSWEGTITVLEDTIETGSEDEEVMVVPADE